MATDSTDGYCDTKIKSVDGVSNSAACGIYAADSNIGFRYTINFPVNAK